MPLLEDGDVRLSESIAILLYIAGIYDPTPLLAVRQAEPGKMSAAPVFGETARRLRESLLAVVAPQLRVPFDFSFDNFRTIRRARLVGCHGSIAGIQFVQP